MGAGKWSGDGSGAREDRSASVSEWREKNNPAMVSSVHSVSSRDDRIWTHSLEKVYYRGAN